VGGIISFWWATSFRYGGRDHLVLVGAFNRNQQRNSGKKSVAHLARESDANAIELNARN
jgi:hypothetical protein